MTNTMSDKPIAENGWDSMNRNAPVYYHDDGPIGTAISRMGADVHLDIDGEPLANVLGDIATEVVFRRRSPAEGLSAYKDLRDRVPSGSEARLWLDRAIEDMDAPEQSVPAVPDITPEPIVTLIADLNAIPIVRKNPAKELNPLVEVANDFAEGRTLGSQMIARVRDLRNRRHESLGDCGKFTIDDAIDRAVTALENMPRSELRPPQG
jgi:hypothetical protein